MSENAKTQYFRQNKNFLDKPIFTVDEVNANKEGHIWKPVNGFRMETDYRLPARTDQTILYFILMKSQEQNWNPKLTLSKYEILKGAGLETGRQEYERLKDTLERWYRVRIYFENTFVNAANGKVTKSHGAFGIIDTYDFQSQEGDGSTKIYIRLSSEWLEVLRTHAFFEMLDFRVIRQLSSPLSLRLYEILSKNFYKRDTWKIDSMKLAAMIPLQVKYASDCINKIKPLISQINKACGGEVWSLEIKKPVRGVAVLVFRKDEKAVHLPPVLPFPGLPAPVPGANPVRHEKAVSLTLLPKNEDQDFDPADFFSSLSETDQKSLLTDFEATLNAYNLKRYKTKGLEGVKIAFRGFCANCAGRK